MPKYNYIPKNLTAFAFSSLDDPKNNNQKQQASDFLNSLYGWAQQMFNHSEKAVNTFYNNVYFDDKVDKNSKGSDLQTGMDILVNTPFAKGDKFTPKNVDKLWSQQKSEIVKNLGGFLASGGLLKAVENSYQYKDGKVNDKAEFCVNYIEPLMSNNGKLFKDIIVEYAKSKNIQIARAKELADELYEDQLKNIRETIKTNPQITKQIKATSQDNTLLSEEEPENEIIQANKLTRKDVYDAYKSDYDYKPEVFCSYEIYKLDNLKTDQDKEEASEFLYNTFGWIDHVRKFAPKAGYSTFSFKDFEDKVEPKNNGQKLQADISKLFDPKREINKNNVQDTWQADRNLILTSVGGILASGALHRSIAKKTEFASDKDRADYYVNIIDPLFANKGKMFKDFIFNYAQSIGHPENVARNMAQTCYEEEKKEVYKIIQNDFDLSNELLSRNKSTENIVEENDIKPVVENDLIIDTSSNNKINDEIRLENSNNNIIIDKDNKVDKFGMTPKQVKETNDLIDAKENRRKEMKEQLYANRHIDNAPTFRESVNRFHSIKILALGPESDEHEILNKDITNYSNYVQNNPQLQLPNALDSLSKDQQIEALAEKVFRLEKMKRHAEKYIDEKIENGLPTTPAGKDRLAGAYGIADEAEKWLKDTEKDIKRLGLANNLKSFKHLPGYDKIAYGLTEETLRNTKSLGRGTVPKVLDDLYNIANFCAIKVKYNLMTDKDGSTLDSEILTDKFKDMTVAETRKALILDRDFRTSTAHFLNRVEHDGNDAVYNMNNLLKDYQTDLQYKQFNQQEDELENSIMHKNTTIKLNP